MTQNYEKNNQVYISGELLGERKFSHESYGEKFYENQIRIERLSGAADTLPVIISERIMPKDWAAGKTVHILGQFRSHNEIVDGKSRLMLYVFACELLNAPADRNTNRIILGGYVCKKPSYRTTPFNREIADLLVAVNRAYNKSDYIPTIAWGRNARFVKGLEPGERVVLEGRIQSREYIKKTATGDETRIAYEVSISKICTSNDENDMPYKLTESQEDGE